MLALKEACVDEKNFYGQASGKDFDRPNYKKLVKS